MTPRLALILFICGQAFAQFESLSTDYNGSRLFFSSQLAQAGTNQPFHGKLFLADRSGIHPIVIRERVWTPSLTDFYGIDAGYSNMYDITAVDFADGALSFSAARDCQMTSGTCQYDTFPEIYDSKGQALRIDSTFPPVGGATRLSPNGRWGISTGIRLTGFATHFLLDFATGKVTQIPGVSTNFSDENWRAHDIANDGTFVMAQNSLLIYRGSQLLYTGPPTNPEAAAIDAAGKRVVWLERSRFRTLQTEAPETTQRDLTPANATEQVVEEPGRQVRPQIAQPLRPVFELSDNGRTLMVLANPRDPQVFLIDTENGARTQLTAIPEGVRTATLSGDGNIVWLVTRTGRLIRLSADKPADQEEWVGPLAAIDSTTYSYLQGSLLFTPGQPITVPAWIAAGTTPVVTANGVTAPVLATGNGSVTVQIPWEAPPGQITFVLQTRTDSGWTAAPLKVGIQKFYPRAVPALDGTGTHSIVAHQNFESLVSPASPARPGEIVHLYATGLGPVNAPTETGKAAPANPLPVLGNRLVCTGGAELIYAGLAPGTIGYYQVSVRVPSNSSGNEEFHVRCELVDLIDEPWRYLDANIPVEP